MNDKVEDITVQILVSIRDEIRGLRQSMEEEIRTVRREANDRFQAVESELSEVTETLKRFVYHLERDPLALANDVEDLKKRAKHCEERLGLG
jgi:predicted nuclease with TOPRIM domain